MINTGILGEAFELEQKFENPDGSPICFNRDFWGRIRSMNVIAGPFASAGDAKAPLF